MVVYLYLKMSKYSSELIVICFLFNILDESFICPQPLTGVMCLHLGDYNLRSNFNESV